MAKFNAANCSIELQPGEAAVIVSSDGMQVVSHTEVDTANTLVAKALEHLSQQEELMEVAIPVVAKETADKYDELVKGAN